MSRSDPGAILLAAGGSARLGRPKQLIQFEGRSLVRHAAEAARASIAGPVIVVVGAQEGAVRAELAGLEVEAVVNAAWQTGMGSSIRCGLRRLMEIAPDCAGVIVMPCDQPRVTAMTLGRILAAQQASGRALCAAAFGDGIIGPPAFFSRDFFDRLLQVPDGVGAKQVLVAHLDELCQVACPEAAFDIDTAEDLRDLLA